MKDQVGNPPLGHPQGKKTRLHKFEFLEVVCRELVSEGLGICHPLDSDFDRTPVTGFVWGLLPGETGIAFINRVKKDHFHGTLAKISDLGESSSSEKKFVNEKWALFNQSELRVPDQCDNFISCGGCKLMHLDYQTTLDFKTSWFKSQLKHNQIDFDQIRVHGSPKKFHYRNNVQVHINKNKERGFYAPYSYRTVEFPEHGCRIFDQESFDKAFPEEHELVRCVRSRLDQETGKVQIWHLNSKEDKNASFDFNLKLPHIDSLITINVPNLSFFQVNLSAIPEWLKRIDTLLEQALVETKHSQDKIKVLELFSGFGFITNMLAVNRNIESVGIDILPAKELSKVKISCHDQDIAEKINQTFSKFKQNYFQADLSMADKHVDTLKTNLAKFTTDVLIINPPRSGFKPDQIKLWFEKIIANYDKPIIYSSCNAATFTRDLQSLKKIGYQVISLDLFDFFPFTSHYEVLGLLIKN